jgi:hypothetical protein
MRRGTKEDVGLEAKEDKESLQGIAFNAAKLCVTICKVPVVSL